MNVSTILKWAKHQSNFISSENVDDDFRSCDSNDDDIPPIYFEKRQKSITGFEMEKRVSTVPLKPRLILKLASKPMKRVHGYKTFKITVLGAPNVGKTSLIERFINGTFTEDHLPTIADTYETGLFLNIQNKLKQFDIELDDFTGALKEDFPEIYEEKILQSDGFIVVYSKDEPDSLAKVVEIVADINILQEAPVVMVLENKCDCKKNKANNTTNNKTLTKFQIINCRHMEVSAKSNIGVKEAISSLIHDLEEDAKYKKQIKKQIVSTFFQRLLEKQHELTVKS